MRSQSVRTRRSRGAPRGVPSAFSISRLGVIALGEELVLTRFGLRKDGRVLRRLAEVGQKRIVLQNFVSAETVSNRAFHERRGECVSATGVVVHGLAKPGFWILE